MNETSVDEHLLTIAKLRETVKGEIDGPNSIHEHSGIVENPQHRSALSFLHSATDFADSSLGHIVSAKKQTDAATKAVQDEITSIASHLVGVTEIDYDASSISLTMELVDKLYNNDAPAFVTLAGNPNTGKTNTLLKLVELYNIASRSIEDLEELHVISNISSWVRSDSTVTSMHDLMLELLNRPNTPKAVIIDEASTHFDSRTNRRNVATQWTPAAKRYAKLDVQIIGLVGHTGKDLHPEVKRMTTLAIEKNSKTEAELYERWPADADAPTDPLYPDPLSNIEKATGYHPDDAAPWSWNLKADLFSKDYTWSELRDALNEHGPDTG